jgi:uncharacterized membrane protein
MRFPGDLVLAVGLAAVGAAAALLPDLIAPLKIPLTAPLVLVVPGYVLTRAIFPERSILDPERLLLSVGLSLVCAVLGGVLLNVTPWGLGAGTWAIYLFALTVAACVVAVARRSPVAGQAQDGLISGAAWPLNARQAALLACSALVVAGALWVAHTPVPQEPQQGYTLLWTLPQTDANDTTVRVGVRNLEATPLDYQLRIVAAGQLLQQFAIQLQPVDEWQADVTLPPSAPGPVEAILYRSDAPDTVYRRTLLRGGA